MAMSQLAGRPPGTHLVCNGFKDAEYMELVGGCSAQCCVCAGADARVGLGGWVGGWVLGGV